MQSESSSVKLSMGVRVILSALLLVHLTAVVVEPLLFFTRSRRGESEAVAPVRQLLRPYTEMAYLNHGYFFFAPEAGPSHLMRFTLENDDGSASTLQFPDKQAQWPRLLYHRHFMLSEFLHTQHVLPPDASLATANAASFRAWQNDRNRFEMVRDSYLAHVMHRYGAKAATVDRIEHQLPSSQDVLQNNLPLNDPRLYLTLPDEAFDPATTAQPGPNLGPLGSAPPFPAPPTGEVLPIE